MTLEPLRESANRAGAVTLRRENGRTYPAVCVKVHTGFPSAEEISSVRAELDGPADFDTAWIEALQREEPSVCDDSFAEVCHQGFQRAEERSREIFAAWAPGERLECFSAGRSGGWVIVDGLPDVDDWSEHPGLREAWDTFAAECKAAVADIPRAWAWDLCANLAIPRAEDKAREVAEAQARAEATAREDSARFAMEAALRDCIQSLQRLPDTEGAWRATCIGQAMTALRKAREAWPQGRRTCALHGEITPCHSCPQCGNALHVTDGVTS